MGAMVIRGDDVAMVGELDVQKDNSFEYNKLFVEGIKPVYP